MPSAETTSAAEAAEIIEVILFISIVMLITVLAFMNQRTRPDAYLYSTGAKFISFPEQNLKNRTI